MGMDLDLLRSGCRQADWSELHDVHPSLKLQPIQVRTELHLIFAPSQLEPVHFRMRLAKSFVNQGMPR